VKRALSAGEAGLPRVVLCIVHGEPSFWPHTNKYVPDHVPRGFDVRVAHFGAEITAREGAPLALKIRRFDRHDRPLHADVLIRQRFRLHAQTESARPFKNFPASRSSFVIVSGILDLRLPGDPHGVWREKVGPNPVMMIDDLVRTEMRSVAHRVAVGDRDHFKAQRRG